MKAFRLFTLLIIASLILSACAANDLEQNRAKWDKAEMNYTFNLSVGCFCVFSELMPLNVYVVNGKVESITNRDGNALSPENLGYLEQYATVDKLFDELDRAYQDSADQIDVTYDPTYGFPAKIYIDWIEQAADDEISFEITNFEMVK